MATKRKPVLTGSHMGEILDNHFDQITDEIPEVVDLVKRFNRRVNKQASANETAYTAEVLRVAKTKGYTAATGGDIGLIELKQELLAKEDQIVTEFQERLRELVETKFTVEIVDDENE